ncbi:MAG: hypothetical protein WA890_14995 [Micromonospora sp.]
MLLTIALVAHLVGLVVALSFKRSADLLEEDVRRLEPVPPEGWTPRHRASALAAPTRELAVIHR